MPLFLTAPETIACASRGGCGAVHELAPGALAPMVDDVGELVGLAFACSCGAAMFAPRVSADEAAATLADPGVVWARRMWHRLRWAQERELRHEGDLEALAFADWPVSPGEHSANLAALWELLERAGWPDVQDMARAERHRAVLARWPVAGEAVR